MPDHASRNFKLKGLVARNAGEGPRFSIPEGGVLRSDGIGDGNFRSKRTHGLHKGVDITANPGQMVPAPIDGVVSRKGIVYGDKDNRGLLSTHIKGTGKWEGFTVKMFYMDNTALKVGAPVKRGAPLGPAQDVRVKHGPKMRPHVHYEVRKDGKLIDPTDLLIGKK